MAASVLFTFSLCLLLCAVFSKPVAHDSEAVQSSVSVDTVVIKKILELDTATSPGVDSARDTELVRSFDSVVMPSEAESREDSRRIKRDTINSSNCPSGTIRFKRTCTPFESYEQMVQEEEAD